MYDKDKIISIKLLIITKLTATEINEEIWDEEHQVSIEEEDENIEGVILVASISGGVWNIGLKRVKREGVVKFLGLRENFRSNGKTLIQLQIGHISLMGQDYLLGQAYLRGGLYFLFSWSIALIPLFFLDKML